jgi:hypothetical protein
MAKSSRARDGKSGKVFDVDEILKNVKVHEEELNEVVLGKEGVKLRPEVRKTYNMHLLKNTLMAA